MRFADDWHTGLGAYGHIHPLVYLPHNSQEWELTCRWWGAEDVRRGAAGWK